MSKTHFDVDLEAELEGVEDSDEDMDKVSYLHSFNFFLLPLSIDL